MKKALVIGSLNMDMTVKVEDFPKLGETIFGNSYYESCGGKGGNQAVSIAKQGAAVEMAGMVGNDSHGKILIENLQKNGIKTDNIIVKENETTGKAVITVNSKGNNSIIVLPGSNFKIEVKDIEKNMGMILQNDIVVLQNEIPSEVVEYILETSKKMNKITVYNPAPSRKVNDKITKNTDYLILNETETEEIFEINMEDSNYTEKILKLKKEKSIKYIILTLGKKGCILFDENNEITEYGSYEVKAVDTTAAGDAFLGGIVAGISKGKSLDESIKYATAVAAITVTREGAQDSIPLEEEVIKFLNTKK